MKYYIFFVPLALTTWFAIEIDNMAEYKKTNKHIWRFSLIKQVDKVNWPLYRVFKADILNVSPLPE